MDFLFSGFIEFEVENGRMMHLDASKVVAIEQSHDENKCYATLDYGEERRRAFLCQPLSCVERFQRSGQEGRKP